MPASHPTPRLLACVLGLLTTTLSGVDKIDLARVTPVPADQPVPLQDFFRPLVLQEPKLNPSGTHIAALITLAEDRHQLLVYDLKAQKGDFLGWDGDYDISGVSWLNDARLLFHLGARKRLGLGLMAVQVGQLNDAYPLLQGYGTSLIAIPPADRLHPLVWNRQDGIDTRRQGGAAVINSDIRSGKMKNLLAADLTNSDVIDIRNNNDRHIISRYPVPPGGLTTGYLPDRDGRLAYAVTAEKGVFSLLRLEGDKWITCPVDLEEVDVIAPGEQPGQIVVVGPRQEGKPRALQFMNAATGQLGDVLLQDKSYDFSGGLYRHPVSRDILGASFERNGPRSYWFNEEYKALQKILDGFFPGLVVRLISGNEAQTLFLVATFSDRQPVIYNWVDIEKRTVGLVRNSAPWIDPKRMQAMNIIQFKTRDGRQLDAYLTMPAGATKENPPPLVMLCHGGPWSRDRWGFDPEAQFLASRGYAVLQTNYRGSTGINWMFPKEDEWDFRKMHDDVTDAARRMIASGLIDPKRIGIMGASFGGYLAIAGVVNEPDLYRCAVTNAGVFDWEDLIKNKKYDQFDSPVFGRMVRKLGDARAQPEKFEAISPGRHADRIRVPVFVAGGKDDGTVEIEQSRNLIASLEKNHVPHEKLLVGEEGHGMAHLENQVELYSRIEAFLAKNLMPKK